MKHISSWEYSLIGGKNTPRKIWTLIVNSWDTHRGRRNKLQSDLELYLVNWFFGIGISAVTVNLFYAYCKPKWNIKYINILWEPHISPW